MPPSLAFGVYDPGCPPRVAVLSAHAKRLGAPIRIVSWYQAWGSGFRYSIPRWWRMPIARAPFP